MTDANSNLTLAAKLGEEGSELARWPPSCKAGEDEKESAIS
jgi:hypothetical protein